jgi:DNA polymerase type B, organellar and viral
MSVPRPEHRPEGEPCGRCGLAAARHRVRGKRARTKYHRDYQRTHERAPRRVIGIDGEGYTLKSGAHRYVYLAACDAEGLVSDLSRPKGIAFPELAEWLLSLPRSAMLVGYSLGYDRCKWVESLPDAAVYSLMHPEERREEGGRPRAVRVAGYRVNLVSSLFTLARSGARQRVWDVFKFFQSSFVKALQRWDIGTPAERARIEKMKAKRGSFGRIGQSERLYCQSECSLLARLVRELLDAHEAEDLRLTSFYGPGSTAAVILKGCNAESQNAQVPPAMARAVASAYFGGRFECSRVGPVEGPVFGADIASAYPAAMAGLPCFAHGRWVHAAMWQGEPWSCVHYELAADRRAPEAWGPLPFRLPDGNIIFPTVSAGGWVWDVELRAGLALHPGVRMKDAWVWRQACDCPPPFGARIAELFERRKQWGKSSRGIVLKLGLNSMYGKSAQRVGAGRFRCMVRAGLITSTTRAMLLGAVARARDPWSILELATDSVLSTERLTLPRSPFGALGAWEAKPWPAGVFLVRPGLRFSLGEGSEESTAARGLGVRTLHANRARVLRAWEKAPMAPLTIQQPTMFHGARSAVRRVRGQADPSGDVPWSYVRGAEYGRWTDPEPRRVGYQPAPKRCEVLQGYRLLPWELPLQGESVPYGEAPDSPMAEDFDDLRTRADEQPEAGMLEVL